MRDTAGRERMEAEAAADDRLKQPQQIGSLSPEAFAPAMSSLQARLWAAYLADQEGPKAVQASRYGHAADARTWDCSYQGCHALLCQTPA